MSRRSGRWLAWLLVLPACTCAGVLKPGQQFTCQADADCGAGETCIAGTCAAPGMSGSTTATAASTALSSGTIGSSATSTGSTGRASSGVTSTSGASVGSSSASTTGSTHGSSSAAATSGSPTSSTGGTSTSASTAGSTTTGSSGSTGVACAASLPDGGLTPGACGGSCPGCLDGSSCTANADCQSGHCATGVCQPPSCNDGIQDGNETDVDCGGSCPACPLGDHCRINSDCASGLTCQGGVCSCGVIGEVAAFSPQLLDFAGTSAAPQVAYACDNCPLAHAVRYAVCDTACDTAQASFGEEAYAVSDSVDALSLVGLPSGGSAIGWISGNPPVLHYDECLSNCSQPGNWVHSVVGVADGGVDASPIRLAALGSIRGIAYGYAGETWYAECPSGCTTPGQWASAPSGAPEAAVGRPGLVLARGDGGVVVRRLWVGTTYGECTGACLDGGVAWATSVQANDLSGEVQLTLSPSGLPEAAGYAAGGTVDVEACTRSPCTEAANWQGATAVTDGLGGADRLGFEITAGGDGRLVYTSTQGDLRLAGEDGGVWSETALTACSGDLVVGSQPALLLTTAGDPAVVFAAEVTLPDGGTGPGISYLTDGP